MNASVLNRRRIERYAQLLDEANGGRRHHSRSPIDDELTTMLVVGERLGTALPTPAPSETFRRDTRSMLMAVAERDGIGRTAGADIPVPGVSRPAVGRASVGTVHESAAGLSSRRRGLKERLTPNRGRTRAAILVGLAVGTLALSGISTASGNAMPGGAFYGVKRQGENAKIALARTPVGKGDLYLDFARMRLAEAEQIQPSSNAVETTLKTMDDQTYAGVKLLLDDAVRNRDAKALATVDQFVNQQNQQLLVWVKGLPQTGAAYTRAAASQRLLGKVATRVSLDRAALACPATIRITTTDSLGPLPSCP